MTSIDFAYNFARDLYRKAWPPLERLVFLHLPKCGGTSLDFSLRKAYKTRFHKTIHLIPCQSKFVSELFDDDIEAFRSQLLAYHIANDRYRYISGHYTFDERIGEAFSKKWTFMTVLREPVSRWYSNYFYNKYKTQSEHTRINQSLDEFIQTKRAQDEGSLYTRFLTGYRKEEDAVQRASENLNKIHLVGLLEEQDILIQDLSKLLDISIDMPRLNASPRNAKRQSEEITPEIHAQVIKLCEPDSKIYETVRKRLSKNQTWLSR